MLYVLINYNFDPSWVKDYTDNYLIYDRSDDGKDWCKDVDPNKVVKTPNLGNVDYDRLDYIVEHYDDMPEVFLLAKSNLFKYISKEEFDKLKNNRQDTPLLTQNHRVYSDAVGPVSYYQGGMYWERNNSWYLNVVPARYVNSWAEWAQIHFLPNPPYLPFAPGGNYIITRATIHKYGVDYYAKMRDMLDYAQLPGEAQLVERSYFLMWQ